MTDMFRVTGLFLWGLGYGFLGVCCDGTAQVLSRSGLTFMRWADELWDAALKVSEWD